MVLGKDVWYGFSYVPQEKWPCAPFSVALVPASVSATLSITVFGHLWSRREGAPPLRALEVNVTFTKVWSSSDPSWIRWKSEGIKTGLFVWFVVSLEIKIPQNLNRFLNSLLSRSWMCQKPHSKIFPRQNSQICFIFLPPCHRTNLSQCSNSYTEAIIFEWGISYL